MPTRMFYLLPALCGIFLTSCASQADFRVSPGYENAKLTRVVLLPITGVSEKESEEMVAAIEKTLLQRKLFEVVLYREGLHPLFDKTLKMARSVDGAIPLDLLPDIAQSMQADGVIVTHQMKIEQGAGVAYRFESETGARIRTRHTTRHPKIPEESETSGFTPITMKFPSGLIIIKLFEMPSRQQWWEAKREIKNISELNRLLETIPVINK